MKAKMLRIFGFGSVLGLLATMSGPVVQASVPESVAVYSGTGYAAGVHAIYYTGTLSSLTTGAVDNRYPLANVYQDVAPSSNARASTEDLGPFYNTLYALGKVPNPAPYAVAQYPPTPAAPADNTCDPNQSDPGHQCPQGSAEAHARELTSSGSAVYNGQGSGADNPTFTNATAETTTVMNPDGSLKITTHSHVGQASFPGGLVIQNVDVVTSVISRNGNGSYTETVAPGTVTFNGQAVQVTDQGVTLGPATIPTSGIGTGNAAGPVTFRVFTVQPEAKKDGSHATVFATGTHVAVSQGAVAGQQSVPPNAAEYVLGEGRSDGFANPAPPTVTTPDLSAFPGGTDLGLLGQPASTDTTTTTDNGGAGSYPTVTTPSQVRQPPAKPQPKTHPAALRLPDRPNLALMFFAWEALIMVTAAVLVWARRARLAALQD